MSTAKTIFPAIFLNFFHNFKEMQAFSRRFCKNQTLRQEINRASFSRRVYHTVTYSCKTASKKR